MDWKATARTGTLMLREMDDLASGDMTIALDGAASHLVGEPPETNFELAVQAAGSVAACALRAGRGVSLLLQDDGWSTARLSPHADGLQRLLETLARAKTHRTSELAPSLQALLASRAPLGRTQVLTLIVLAVDDRLARSVAAIRETGRRVAVIHVDGGSFAAGAQDTASQASLLSLATSGVSCLTLRRDDDLRTALSPWPAEQGALVHDALAQAAVSRVPRRSRRHRWAGDRTRRHAVDRRRAGLGGDRGGPGRRPGARPPPRLARGARPAAARRVRRRRTQLALPATVHGLGEQWAFYAQQLRDGAHAYATHHLPFDLAAAPELKLLLALLVYWAAAVAAFLALSLRRALPAIAILLALLGLGLTIDESSRVLSLPLLFLLLSGCLLMLSRSLERERWKPGDALAGGATALIAAFLALTLLGTTPVAAGKPWQDWRSWGSSAADAGTVMAFDWMENYPKLLNAESNAAVMRVRSPRWPPTGELMHWIPSRGRRGSARSMLRCASRRGRPGPRTPSPRRTRNLPAS